MICDNHALSDVFCTFEDNISRVMKENEALRKANLELETNGLGLGLQHGRKERKKGWPTGGGDGTGKDDANAPNLTYTLNINSKVHTILIIPLYTLYTLYPLYFHRSMQTHYFSEVNDEQRLFQHAQKRVAMKQMSKSPEVWNTGDVYDI